MNDIDRIDEILDDVASAGFVSYTSFRADTTNAINLARQRILALMNEARVDELKHLRSANDDWDIHYVRDNGSTIGIYDRITELKKGESK